MEYDDFSAENMHIMTLVCNSLDAAYNDWTFDQLDDELWRTIIRIYNTAKDGGTYHLTLNLRESDIKFLVERGFIIEEIDPSKLYKISWG